MQRITRIGLSKPASRLMCSNGLQKPRTLAAEKIDMVLMRKNVFSLQVSMGKSEGVCDDGRI